MSDLDIETKLKLYSLVVSRYKDIISEKEQKSITEMRSRIEPYSDFVKSLRQTIAGGIDYDTDFMSAVQKFAAYIRKIKNFEFLFNFSMDFKEIEKLSAAPIMDKALLLASLLRSIEAKNTRIYVTDSGRIYVGFDYNNERHLMVPETGSILVGDDVSNLFEKDPLEYSFNDQVYENYEE
ncbi:MAG: hypothetical protein ABII22_00505 [Candidatus Micrarchaeota archaeon]